MRYKLHIVVAHGRGTPFEVVKGNKIDENALRNINVQKTLTLILRLDDAQCRELDSQRV